MGGAEVTVVQLRPVFQQPDRTVREQAWRLAMNRQLADRAAIDDLWRQFMDVRLHQARERRIWGLSGLQVETVLRFDYTPEDCIRFHEAIEAAVVPAAVRLTESAQNDLSGSKVSAHGTWMWTLWEDPLLPIS